MSPQDDLEHLLRRDAQRIRPGTDADFAARVRRARQTAPDAVLVFPRARPQARPWVWAAVAAAAVLLVGAWAALRSDDLPQPEPALVVDEPPPELPAGIPAPTFDDFDLAGLMTRPADPLDAEIAAISADLRSTGRFLLGCLPDYPEPRR